MIDLASLFKNLGSPQTQRSLLSPPQVAPMRANPQLTPMPPLSLSPLRAILRAPSTQETDPRILGNGAYTTKSNWHTLNPAQRAQVIDGIHEGWYQVDPATGDIRPTRNFQMWKLQDMVNRVHQQRALGQQNHAAQYPAPPPLAA